MTMNKKTRVYAALITFLLALIAIVINVVLNAENKITYQILVKNSQKSCVENILSFYGEIQAEHKIEYPFYLDNYMLAKIRLKQPPRSLDHLFGVCINNVQTEVLYSNKHFGKIVLDFKMKYEDSFLIQNSSGDGVILMAMTSQ